MGHESVSLAGSKQQSVNRYQRVNQREKQKATNEAASALLDLHRQVQGEIPLIESGSKDEATQTDIAWDIELNRLIEDNKNLRETLSEKEEVIERQSYSEESMKNDSDKLNFYTGLPSWMTFMALFNLVSSYLPSTGRCKLSAYSQVMLFLIKIRLNLANKDIGFRFNIHHATVSKIYNRVLDVMSARLGNFIHWPSRTALRVSMPTSFQKFYKKCCIIIDCTEIFIEQPSDLLARAKTWSQYKHHNTIKFLIGITPQGTVSFLSKCWGGRASDKEITEKSGLLSYLQAGDVVIADRGFTIGDYCWLALSEVCIPPFTRGKTQFTRKEVDWSRELSIVRIHVERVIGTVKQKFTILQGTLQLSMVGNIDELGTGEAQIDKLVKVCCALFNFCPPIVPLD
jgi:hypothetical protein